MACRRSRVRAPLAPSQRARRWRFCLFLGNQCELAYATLLKPVAPEPVGGLELLERREADLAGVPARVIGFEKLNFSIPETDRLRIALETTPS